MTDPSAAAIPRPVDLKRVDYEARSIHLPVVVFGSTAVASIREVFQKTGGAGRDSISFTRPGEASLSYLAMRLGDIRGFQTRVHLYGFDLDHRLGVALAAQAPASAGAVLAFAPGTHTSREAGVLAQILATALPPTVPVVALGDAALAAAWHATTGRAPIQTADNVFEALKGLAKVMLGQLRAQPG